MKNKKLISIFFYICAAYDGLLGILFLLMPMFVYDLYNITPPNHLGYIQFPAMILITFAIMFIQIASEPQKNINLIPFGILLKISYCFMTFGHWAIGDIPSIWKLFAIFDTLFGILFVWIYFHIKKSLLSK